MFKPFARGILLMAAFDLFAGPALSQEKKPAAAEVTVNFKIFDTNEPTRQLTPAKRAIVYARDRQTLKAFALAEPPIKGPSKDGFYEVRVQKGWLVEQLEISVVDGDKDYNPAVLTKVITSADMIVYPGASKSTDQFSFQEYLAQMGTYRALLAQLIEEADEPEKERRRTILREGFRTQLTRMADLEARLISADPEERKAAKKLANEVLKLYGLPYEEEPAPPPAYLLVCPCPTYAVCPPARRCWWGWRR